MEVVINGKAYQIACVPEEEHKVRLCVTKLNTRISEMRAQNPSIFPTLSDDKIFLFQSLALLSDLIDVSEKNIVSENMQDISVAEIRGKLESLQQTMLKVKSLIR